MELTNEAITQLIKKTEGEHSTVRIGVTGGGCAGYEYIFNYESRVNPDDEVFDYGKFRIVINQLSLPYLHDATLDFITEGINEYFKIINPAEVSSGGCGISVQF